MQKITLGKIAILNAIIFLVVFLSLAVYYSYTSPCQGDKCIFLISLILFVSLLVTFLTLVASLAIYLLNNHSQSTSTQDKKSSTGASALLLLGINLVLLFFDRQIVLLLIIPITALLDILLAMRYRRVGESKLSATIIITISVIFLLMSAHLWLRTYNLL